MRLTLILHGNPFEVEVGLGDTIMNIVELAVDQQKTYSLDEVKDWVLTDEIGAVVQMDGQISDLCVLGIMRLFLFPKAGIAA